MKVLIFGDLAQTGFGTVTSDLGKAMLDRGVDVRFASLNEGAWLEGLPDWLDGRVMRFGGDDGWLAMPAVDTEEEATEAIASVVRKIEDIFGTSPWPDGWSPDASIIIGDVASIKLSPIPSVIPDGFPVLHYVPVEGIDLPPRWNIAWQKMTPVAMSEFGANEIARIHGTRPPVVYHGVDTTEFHPASSSKPLVIRGEKDLHVLRSKTECKRFLGLDPDRILLFRADRNVPRKMYPSLLRSLAVVLAKHPDVDFVYHCLTVDQGGDLADDISKFRPDIAARMGPTGFHDTRQTVPRALLAVLYNAADIYVSNSSEGFGLTIAEALACGTPAVGMDFSSVTEVIGPAGLLAPVGRLFDNIYAHLWAGVHEELYAEAVEKLVSSRGARRKLGELGPIHVGASFTWQRAAEQFTALLAERLEGKVAA